MTEVLEQTRSDPPRDSAGGVRGFGTQVGELTSLTTRLVAFNLLYATSAWLIAAAAIAVFWRYPHWYTFIAAFLVVSSRQQALLNCEHEAVHRKFLPTRRWNDLIGRYLCAAPVGSPLGAARDRHLAHHRLLGTSEDPDANLHSGEDKRSGRGLAGYFVRALLGGYAGMVLM